MDIEICPCCGKPKKPKGSTLVYGEGHIQNNSGSAKSGYSGGLTTEGSGARKSTAPATDLAKIWASHRYGGQTLKPALEPIIVFQRPYEGRPVDNITRTGAGALNIDGGRVGTDELIETGRNGRSRKGTLQASELNDDPPEYQSLGRWPSNLLIHHNPDCQPGQCSEGCPVERLGEMSGESESPPVGSMGGGSNKNQVYGDFAGQRHENGYGDSGTAARYFFQATWHHEILEQLTNADPVFYTAKASKTERQAGLDGPNNHPTLKSISLTSYLAKLLAPPEAYAPRRILIPFCGTGSEMIGAVLAGWEEVTGIEQSAPYCRLAESRLAWWSKWPGWGQTDVEKILQAANDKETEAGQISLFDLLEAA